MNKPGRKYKVEKHFDPSIQSQPIDQVLIKSDEKKDNQMYQPMQFYTKDTIINLIAHIKSL